VNDQTVMKWRAAALAVTRLQDEIPLATLELSHASNKIGRLAELLKIDQEHLTSVLAEQKAAQAALDEAHRQESSLKADGTPRRMLWNEPSRTSKISGS